MQGNAVSATVVVVGAVNVDLTIRADRLPRPGETVVGRHLVRSGGGKGANAAVAAAALTRTVLVGAVGDDPGGRFALEDLAERRVEVESVLRLEDESTGSALIVVDEHGENQIAVGLGANAALDPDHVAATVRGAPDGSCVLVSTEIPVACVSAAVRTAAARRLPCVLNPAPASRELLALLDSRAILTPNAGEATDLARYLGLPDLHVEAVAGELARRTQAPVVVTLGPVGACLAEPGVSPTSVPAVSVERVVDTTGAGDCFNGTLAAALSTGAALEAAVAAALRAAGDSVGHAGARRPPL